MNLVADFRDDFMSDVGARAQSSGIFLQEAFFELVTEVLIETGEILEADYAPWKARGMRIDGHGGDPATQSATLTLFILDFKQPDELETLTATELKQIFARATEFVERSRTGRIKDQIEETDPAYSLADMIQQRWAKIRKVRLILICDRILSSRIDSTPSGEMDERSVTLSVWDIGRLARHAEAGKTAEAIEIDLLEDHGRRIPALNADVGDSGYDAYLCVVPAALLGTVYDRYGARLLEQNVRVFLQARGKVNRRIRDTITTEPEMFFAYNNGITATAESIETEKNGDALFIRKLKNFQIVNGGQTTASVHQAWMKKTNLDHVHIQMKLTVIPEEAVDDVVPRISEYANSQNKVSAIDFFSNHPFHRRIEEMSRRLLAPAGDGEVHQTHWFYERARGQYQNERSRARTPSMRREFELKHPPSQRFDKGQLAKYWMPWSGKPHLVARGPQKNFLEFAKYVDRSWQTNSDVFGDAWFRDTVAKAILFRTTEKLVTGQDWYVGGGSRAKIVPYALYALSEICLKANRAMDYEAIWKRQAVNEELSDALTKCAEAANQVIYLDEANYSNRAEYAKLELCSKKLAEALPNIDSIDTFTVGKDEDKSRTKTALKVRKIDNGIEAQRLVLEAGATFWTEVKVWAGDNRQMSEKDAGILTVASQLPKRIPSEKQSLHLIDIINRLNAAGARFEI